MEAVKTKPEAADMTAENSGGRPDHTNETGRMYLKLSDDESDTYDEDHGDSDGFNGSARGARISFSCNLGECSALEEEGIEACPGEDSSVGDKTNVESTDQPLDCHASDGKGRSAAGHELDDERGRREAITVKCLGEAVDGEEAGISKERGFAQCAEEAAPAAADRVVEAAGTLAATAELTPDSAALVHFSPGSTAIRSTNGSMSETPTRPAAGSSSPAYSTGMERKVSLVAGLLRRFSSREIANPDPVDALRVDPLDFDFDDA